VRLSLKIVLLSLGVTCLSASLFLGRHLVIHMPHCWPRSQQITCVNNLKQIGLALKTWALDHSDHYSFGLGTDAGGTADFCAVGPDRSDSNAATHFVVMSNELNTPLVLLCPKDRSRKPARDFGHLTPENVSYQLRTGTNINNSNPHAIVAICPVDGNFLQCDGSVIGEKPPMDPVWKPYVDLVRYDAGVRANIERLAFVAILGLVLLCGGMRLKSCDESPSQ